MFKKIASNTIFQVLSKAWTAIISIFLISILTNYFDIVHYWIYSKIYNYLWIFAFLADLWLYTIAIREISSNKKDSSKIVWNIMTLRWILGIIVLFLALAIAYFLPWYNSSLALTWVFIVWFFTIFWLFNSSILALMQSNMKMEFSMFSAIFWKIVNVSLIAIIVYYLYPADNITNYDNSLIYIFIAWLFWIFINTVLNFIYANRITPIRFLFDYSFIKQLFLKSLPYWIALFLSVIYFKVDIILLSILEPWEQADISIALYSVPMKIIEVLIIVWMFFLNSILPSLTNLFKENKIIEIDNLVGKSFKILLSLGLFILTLWLIFNNNIIEIVSNKDYIDSSKYLYTSLDVLNITLFVLLFNFIASLFIYLLIATDNQSRLLRINIYVTIFNIIWNILLIPYFSFYWAAIITLISQIILSVMWFFYTKNIFKIKIDYIFILKIIVLSLITYLLWYFLVNNYSIWLFLDIFIYWSLLVTIYWLISFRLIKS